MTFHDGGIVRPESVPVIDDGCSYPMPDYLARTLAAEEHRQGMAYGDDADHCGECAAEARRRMQAECEHDGETVELTRLGHPRRELWCQDCGLVREVER